jgi:O-antigen ligase
VNRAYALYVFGFATISLATLSDLLLGTHVGALVVSTPVYQVDLENVADLARYGGPTGHPNTLGYVSVIGLLLCLARIMETKGMVVWAAVVGLVLFWATLIVSGSRAALLGLFIGYVVLIAFATRSQRKRLLVTSLVGVVAIWIALKATGLERSLMNPVQRLAESVQPRRSFEADWQRRQDLRLAGRLLSDDPVTGYGMENIGTSRPPTKVAFKLPHWILLQSWVAGGLLALLGTIWLYASVLYLGWYAVRAHQPLSLGLLAACLAFSLMDMVHPGLDQRFKWFTVAILIATVRGYRSVTHTKQLAVEAPS